MEYHDERCDKNPCLIIADNFGDYVQLKHMLRANGKILESNNTVTSEWYLLPMEGLSGYDFDCFTRFFSTGVRIEPITE